MTAFVLDASLALSWCFLDEATPETDRILNRLRDEGAVVPQIWPLEVCNILRLAERKGRITANDLDERLRIFTLLPIEIDMATHERAMTHILPLARAEGLTTYDAAYLELALRKQSPLASFDRDLRAAAARLGLSLLPN